MRVIKCDINIDGEKLGFDIIRCKECKFAYRGPDDIVCTYWESDGLEADDFCSRGEHDKYEWDPNCIDDYLNEWIKKREIEKEDVDT